MPSKTEPGTIGRECLRSLVDKLSPSEVEFFLDMIGRRKDTQETYVAVLDGSIKAMYITSDGRIVRRTYA